MVKRIALFGVVSFVLWATCGAVCQSVRRSLPDAPSVQAVPQANRFNAFAEEPASPFRSGGVVVSDPEFMRQARFGVTYRGPSGQESSKTVFEKYLYPTTSRQPSHSLSLNNPGLMSRATYAATRTLITRDLSGKARLNTSYLLRTLTSVAKDTASTPYWRRSRTQPVGDFGAMVGNDAGMNLWHEFGPSIENALKNHTPKFVSGIAAHFGFK
jgi:hypothetical protein